ncbi:MAG: ATP synthase F0 subunit B [Acidobacteriota bacterium]|jgi:F-type H+-transporting ATPase subunit b
MKLRTNVWLHHGLLVPAICAALSSEAWAAETGDRWGPLLEIGRFTNLLLVAAVLVYVGRKPLASFFASRSQAIREQLMEAQKARLEAEARLNEINLRMSSLDDELRQMRAAAEIEAREEHERLVASADREAEKILERARLEIEGLTRAAQLELKAHVAELSVQLAEGKIRDGMTVEDERRLFARFVDRVGGRE